MTLHFKFDENLDPQWGEPLIQRGHIVSTVAEEHLQGADDKILSQICRRLGLCLITADLDFAQTLEYPPQEFPGIIVLRHAKPTLNGMQNLIRQIAAALTNESPIGKLWIVEPGRIRIRGILGQS